jgi:hypothetical protein
VILREAIRSIFAYKFDHNCLKLSARSILFERMQDIPVMPYANDSEMSDRLWELSEKLAREKLPIS